MLRPCRIVKRAARAQEIPGAPPLPHSPDVPAGVSLYVHSIARRYRNRGLSLTVLIAAGEQSWLQAQKHFGPATDQLERWGNWWVQEGILEALDVLLPEGQNPL